MIAHVNHGEPSNPPSCSAAPLLAMWIASEKDNAKLCQARMGLKHHKKDSVGRSGCFAHEALRLRENQAHEASSIFLHVLLGQADRSFMRFCLCLAETKISLSFRTLKKVRYVKTCKDFVKQRRLAGPRAARASLDGPRLKLLMLLSSLQRALQLMQGAPKQVRNLLWSCATLLQRRTSACRPGQSIQCALSYITILTESS